MQGLSEREALGIPLSSAAATTTVSLLSSEAHVNNNDALLLQSTTYEAKYIQPAPLLKGSMYIQNPSELSRKNDDVEINKLTLSQLYSNVYLNYMHKKQRRLEIDLPVLPGLPDFDGDTPTDPESVMQYVKGLSAVYRSEPSDPSPFQLYESLISEFMENTSVSTTPFGLENKENSLNGDYSPSLNPLDANMQGMTSIPLFQSFTPATEVVALTLSMWLSNIKQLKDIAIAMQKIQQFPTATRALSSSVVKFALDTCREMVKGDQCSQERKSEICSLVGLVVLPRCEINEVLEYVGVLEEYSSSSKSSIVPCVLPRYEEVLQSFTLSSPKQCAMSSPVDAYHSDMTRLPLMLSEGTSVSCFCVSPCGRFLAVATVSGMLIFETSSGKLLAQSTDADLARSLWIIQFSSDSSSLILSTKSGLRHVVLSTTLEYLSEQHTDYPAIPTRITEETIDFLYSPRLPSGRKSSLFLASSGKMILEKLGTAAEKSVESFVLCTHIHDDFVGNIAVLETLDEPFTIRLEGGIITLSQGSYSCFGMLSNNTPWHFVSCKWNRGTWTLGVDNDLVELRGARTTQSKTAKFTGSTLLDGTGHVASLVAWCGDGNDGRSIRRFAVDRVLEATAKPFFHLPLDEGEGLWVKELATMRALTIPEQHFVWDDTTCCPFTSLEVIDHKVRLPQQVLLSAEVLISDYQVLITFPSTHKGGDGIVVVVPQGGESISRVYRCPGSYSQTLYSLSRDESLLYAFQQRFSTFSVTGISTTAKREYKLQESGILRKDTVEGTPEWISNEILKRIYIGGLDLLRIPPEMNPLSIENLLHLSSILRTARQNTNPLKLVAVMSLAMVHFERLVSEDTNSLSNVAASLNHSCKQIVEWFPESFVRDVAESLVRAGASQSLTLNDKVNILMNADNPKTTDILDSCMSKESLYSILSFIINDNPSKILSIASGLLKRCKQEEEGTSSGRIIAHLMLWFSIFSVQFLHKHGHHSIVSNLLDLYLQHAKQLLVKRSWDDSMQQTVVHTGLLPLLIGISALCPDTVTPNIEASLLALLDTTPQQSTSNPFSVVFETKQACDVVPGADEGPFKLMLDYKRATSVAITKEVSSSEVTVITSDAASVKPTKLILNNEIPFVKVNGSTLVLFGTGENSLTIVCNYDLSVGTPWSSILRDGICNLLLSVANHLTKKPKPCDVFLAPLLRHGLDTKTLAAHGLDVPGRVNESRFAVDILNDVGDGKKFVDEVWKNMRGSVTPSMRPAFRALLSLLIHSGLTPQQAEDELKLRWFSGEWGSRLQGAGKDSARQLLVDLAKWIASSVFYQRDTSPMYARRASTGRRSTIDSPIAASRSASDPRLSTTSRRSTVRGVMQNQDTLDQVRALFTKGITPGMLESILVERTSAALSTVRGLQLLSSLLTRLQKNETKTLQEVLHVLWIFCGEGSGKHMIESLVGSGVDLEMRVRVAFHNVLEESESLLMSKCGKEVSPQAILTYPALNGSSTIMLLAIMCHPWDAVDCDIFKGTRSEDDMSSILAYLEDQTNIPAYNLPLTSPWRLRRDQSSLSGSSSERNTWNELIGVAEHTSINCILPNSFSVTIPNLQLSELDEGIAFEKTISGPLILRADEAWPMPLLMTCFSGVPRVFYYEVTLTSPCYRFALCLAQCRNVSDRGIDVVYFYENSGTTHDVLCPPFDEGDTIGCGVVATTRRLFFTLNGVFISFMGTIHEKTELLFPTIRINNKDRASFTVNFGKNAFFYDFRRLHPALSISNGPTWYAVTSTAEVTLHYITARACFMQESCKSSARLFLIKCCEVVCRNVNKVTSSIMNVGVGKTDTPESRIQQAVVLSVAESSILNFIATLRHIMKIANSYPLPEVIGEMIFDAVTVLMMLPVHSIQMSTISFLPELLPHIHCIRDTNASANLVKTLFEHAKVPMDTRARIPFLPYWRQCDPRCMSITHMHVASMQPEAQRSIVLGNVLPRTGKVSFVVRVFRKGMSKGHSLKGGYYVGISVVNLAPLSPASNSQSWKAVKPPIVWALHDVSPQLPHATNPTVKPNNFHRTFGSGDAVRVSIDCDKQTVSFYRDEEFLKTLFTDIPLNADLVPFVQLYNDDASVSISSGEMTAPISSATLLGAASVDVLRCMLTLEPFERLVADGLCEELDSSSFPNVTLTLFKSIPDPRILQLCCRTGEKILVAVRRLTQWRVKFSVGNLGYYEQINNLRTASFLTMDGSFDVRDSCASLLGVERCITSLVSALCRLVIPLITTQALCLIEIQQRNLIIEEEKDQWDYLFHGARLNQYLNIQRLSQSVPLLESPRIPHDYTFAAALSHPGFHFSPRFCGRLATVPGGVENTTTPFIAIAEPAVPLTGHFSLRCQLMRGHTGQILGGGYYFGLCTTSFDWKRRDLNVGNPEVWAIHDMDDAPWRLRHLYPGTRFQIAADPGCIIVSGDVVRIEVDRDKGTMHAYRTGINQEEVLLGLIFDNVPKGVELFPFVHLYNTDAVAVLLPSDSDRPAIRTTVPQPHFALCVSNEKRNCDGCVAPHPDVRLTSQIWYKCNECVDYSLCKWCFALCLHSHHSFTEMGANPLVHGSAPPIKTVVGMNVMIPGTTGLYLKSLGCRVFEKHMNCIVESKENNALVLWGVVYKKTATFTVTVDTLNGEPLYLDTPMFIGIGEAEDIVSLSADTLRNRCISGSSNIVSLCSDSSMCRKLNTPSRSPCGFERGSTISIEVNSSLGVATIRRDWLKLGTLSFPTSSTSKSANLVGFVLFGRKNVTASIFPEEKQTFSAVVEDIRNGLLRVVHDGQVRFIKPEHCRVPLTPCQDIPKVNSLGYIFWKKELAQCKVVGVEKDEVTLYFAGENLIQRIPYSRFLTDSWGSVAEERLLYREVGEVGATITDGFIISRLLLILSCLCESERLSPLVLSHCPALLSVLSRLAAVEISNDAPTEFIQEVRTAVAVTCNCLRVMTRSKHLPGYIPSSVMETYRCKPVPNMLMCAVEGPYKGKIFNVLEVKNDSSFKGVEILNNASSKNELLNTADCIPVKQCDGKPWWTLYNGLPCSLLEHTLRVTQAGHGHLNVTMEGEWQGEITIPRRGTGSILLQLKKNCSGLANVVFSSHTTECVVFGEYMRYCRTVRLCLYRATDSTKSHDFHFDSEEKDSSFETAVARLEAILSESGENSLIIVMDGVMDGEGQRVFGEWKPKNDRAGTFAVNSFRRVSLVSPTTNLAHIEPLPDCKDPIIPLPPQRDMLSTTHRLVVLLARHLYLFILNRGGVVDQKAIRGIIHFHSHPLTDQLISNYIDMEQLLRTVYDTLHLILDPNTKPWDSTTLSLLITKCLLLRTEVATYFPALLWDSFHAVIATSHQCGIEYRHHLLKNVITFIEKHREGFNRIYTQLLSVLLTWVDRSVSNFLNSSEIRKDVAAGVELVMALGVPFLRNIIHHIPLAPLQCLIDMADSLREGVALPIVVDLSEDPITVVNAPPVEALCVFGEFVDGVLKVGKIMSSCAAASRGKFYYEVTLPDRLSAPFVVGWGTEEHTEVPSQHVGSDACSFAFTGNELSSKSTKEEYKPGQEVSPGSVIGCLLNMNEKLVAWSVNGVYGPFIPIPIDFGDHGLYAFTSTGSCNGMKVALDASLFEYVPDGYSDLSGRHTRVQIPLVNDMTMRSHLPIRPISFYEQLASYISDVEEASSSKQSGNNSSFSAPSSTGVEVPEAAFLLRYPSVAQLNYDERRDYTKVIRVAESCMATARRFIDLDSEIVDGRLSKAFLLMKHIVRRSFGKNLLVSIPLVEKNNNPPSITVRITELYSTLPRSPEVALQHSILSQIYKQIGSFTNKQLRQSPLFKVHLYISGTGHAPQDLGGPYRQLWTFLSEEIMTHPDKCYPHTDYHRNPLCRYLNNSQRVALVPDSSANSAYDLVLLNFLGKIMGHVAAAKTPLALDFSPFVWKYLVEDILTVKDYYKYVDSVVEKSMDDADFLTSGMAEEIIPNLTEKLSTLTNNDTSEEVMVQNYRRLAEECLVHSMDLQLNAIREGMWCVLPKRVVRCLSWRELERMVCGDSNLTPEIMRQCIEVQLQGPREQAFWRIIDELSLEQRSSFLCFACGQKRLPLIRKVKVTENAESTDHLPRAQSCSSLVTVPPYDTYELFKEKLLIAISHEMEMELA
ncbi:HECT domain [Trypanosoma melophagium]|uniref:HECT domain n=1 Tax=Trypanosoma melophagium TaxID=715481 RepID=UPI00351A77AB|nr:HECT domain [Trypanosoma melophagium]